ARRDLSGAVGARGHVADAGPARPGAVALLDDVDELLRPGLVGERHDRATEAAAGEARADRTALVCELDEEDELGARNLEIVARALVPGAHDRADARELRACRRLERRDELAHALVLRDHVPEAAGGDVVDTGSPRRGRGLGGRDVRRTLPAQRGERALEL